MMLQAARRRSNKIWNFHYFNSRIHHHHHQDEGDWSYSSKWWGTDSSDGGGHTIFRSTSDQGNGVVSVVAYPSSRPDAVEWTGVEKWLRQRYQQIQPQDEHNADFKILGYQWRVLRFNDTTRQSAIKIMAACKKSDPASVFFYATTTYHGCSM